MFEIFDMIRDPLVHATDFSILILLSLSMILLVLLVAYWLYNRRKFQQLSHQIPAGVVKNYLDSIIQNSSALKSSLFRGGGLEVGTGVPSVVPAADFPTGGVGINHGNDEVLAQKNAEVAQLRSEIAIKDATIKDLEEKLATAREKQDPNQIEEINALKKELVIAQTGKGGGAKLNQIMAERDELQKRLREYEVIEDDLANLKTFKEENKQLRQVIEEMGGTALQTAIKKESQATLKPTTERPIDDSSEKFTSDNTLESETKEDETSRAVQDNAESEESQKDDDKDDVENSEELLKEFEKMLN